jgi:hypothetical protein
MKYKDYDNSYELDGIGGSCEEKSGGMRPLEVGDVVDYGGMTGQVINDEGDVWHEFPIHIKFDTGYVLHFTRDGRQFKHQTYSLLKFLGKKDVMVKKWQFLIKQRHRGGIWVATDHLTDKEFNEIYEGFESKKLDFTEIEVEHDYE